MEEKRDRPIRLIILSGIFLAIFIIFTVQLANIQLVNGERYLEEAEQVSARTMSVEAARGEILDRYGRPLTVNRTGYSIVFDKAFLPAEKLNYSIEKLSELLTQTKEEWIDDLPLTKEAPYGFDGSEYYIELLKDNLGLAQYATAENCFEAMVERYSLEGYKDDMARTIMGVRYEMEMTGYSLSVNYVFAEDVSEDTMTIVEEHSYMLPGVETKVESYREYASGTIATHLLGYVGPIYAEEYEELSEKGYAMNDTLGKSGIEAAMEDELRGTDGERVLVQNANGIIVSDTITEEARPGNTVVLTIDKLLQQTAQEALEKEIKSLQENNSPGDGGDASAGAAVVFDIKTFEVLASATYPSYDMNTYFSNYESLLEDENTPLFDRSTLGTYRPGSSFKPAIASIGLELGLIEPDETVTCAGRYDYFDDFKPTCLGNHGSIGVVTALCESCNIFFYETGRRIGIDVIDEYCALLGLGEETGVEVPESSGVMDGMTYREKNGLDWYVGDVLQVSIGQGESRFTPLQLASYVSAIANGGTRYKAHLVKSINTYSNDEVLKETEVEVLNELNFDKSTLDAVKKGMREVCTDGTAAYVFGDYPIAVAGKTGTAEVSEDEDVSDNVIFISFAPYDDPEIAVVSVIEHGAYSSSVCRVAKEIYDAYFFYEGDEYKDDASNTLLQ